VIKIVGFVRRSEELSFDEFLDHWQQRHGPLVSALPGLRRYVQNPAHPIEGREWPYDGMAELWFDDLDAVRDAFRSPESERVREDEPRFTRTIDWFLADERTVIG
jgi:uncharacterized protein (TIGR02118 family)